MNHFQNVNDNKSMNFSMFADANQVTLYAADIFGILSHFSTEETEVVSVSF